METLFQAAQLLNTRPQLQVYVANIITHDKRVNKQPLIAMSWRQKRDSILKFQVTNLTKEQERHVRFTVRVGLVVPGQTEVSQPLGEAPVRPIGKRDHQFASDITELVRPTKLHALLRVEIRDGEDRVLLSFLASRSSRWNTSKDASLVSTPVCFINDAKRRAKKLVLEAAPAACHAPVPPVVLPVWQPFCYTIPAVVPVPAIVLR